MSRKAKIFNCLILWLVLLSLVHPAYGAWDVLTAEVTFTAQTGIWDVLPTVIPTPEMPVVPAVQSQTTAPEAVQSPEPTAETKSEPTPTVITEPEATPAPTTPSAAPQEPEPTAPAAQETKDQTAPSVSED